MKHLSGQLPSDWDSRDSTFLRNVQMLPKNAVYLEHCLLIEMRCHDAQRNLLPITMR